MNTQDPQTSAEPGIVDGNQPVAAGTPAAAPSPTPPVTAARNDFSKVKEGEKPFGAGNDKEERQDLDTITEKLTITQHYQWLERRQEMVAVAQSLQEKRVLFIRCPHKDDFHLATQRLATTLQTMGDQLPMPPAPLRSNKKDQKLEPYFWKNFRRQSEPVIIVLYHDHQEHLKALLAVEDKEVEMDIIRPLALSNIYLICPLPDEPNVRQMIAEEKAGRLLQKTYAYWEMPVVKLELIKRYGLEGLQLLPHFNLGKEPGILSAMKSYNLLKAVDPDLPADELSAALKKVKEDYVDRMSKGLDDLTALLRSNDILAQTIIVVVAIFPAISKEVFQQLVGHLLGEEREIAATDKDAKPPRLLRELWSEKATVRRYLTQCMLQVDDKDGRITIDFAVHGLRDDIRKLIMKDFRILYYDAFDSLKESELLFKPEVLPAIRAAIIQFIVQVATIHNECHDTDWLTRLFFTNMRSVLEDIVQNDDEVSRVARSAPESLADEIMAKVLRQAGVDKLLRYSITQDLILLFAEMINAGNKIFHPTLNAFIRKLIELYRRETTGLDIILPIYKKILLDRGADASKSADDQSPPGKDDDLTREGLIRYFSKALEEGTADQMFEAYDKMRHHFGRWDFLKISKDWIDDKDIGAQSWTRQMAWLYQLDFCWESFYYYFEKEEKITYELFDDSPTGFSPELAELVKHITAPDFLTACDKLLRYNDGFLRRAYWLEILPSGVIPLIDRIEDRFVRAYTLSADVIENWFYILQSDKATTEGQDDPGISAFTTLVLREADPATLKLILQYWRHKGGIYSQTILVVDRNEPKEEKAKKCKALTQRRACLRQLLNIIATQPK